MQLCLDCGTAMLVILEAPELNFPVLSTHTSDGPYSNRLRTRTIKWAVYWTSRVVCCCLASNHIHVCIANIHTHGISQRRLNYTHQTQTKTLALVQALCDSLQPCTVEHTKTHRSFWKLLHGLLSRGAVGCAFTGARRMSSCSVGAGASKTIQEST